MGSHERALATTLFALAPFLGPVLGPIVGGFVVEKHGFRWVFWVQFIFAWCVPSFLAVRPPKTDRLV
jgi:MFS family permease